MNIKQVKAFLSVAESMSFAQAAHQPHLSQPALSLAIKSLEESSEGKLLTRTTTLIPKGEASVPITRLLLAQWQDAEDEMKQRFALQMDKTSIAAMPFFADSLLPKAMHDDHQHFPNIQISIDDVLSDVVVDRVSNNSVELGVTFAQYYPSLPCWTH